MQLMLAGQRIDQLTPPNSPRSPQLALRIRQIDAAPCRASGKAQRGGLPHAENNRIGAGQIRTPFKERTVRCCIDPIARTVWIGAVSMISLLDDGSLVLWHDKDTNYYFIVSLTLKENRKKSVFLWEDAHFLGPHGQIFPDFPNSNPSARRKPDDNGLHCDNRKKVRTESSQDVLRNDVFLRQRQSSWEPPPTPPVPSEAPGPSGFC